MLRIEDTHPNPADTADAVAPQYVRQTSARASSSSGADAALVELQMR